MTQKREAEAQKNDVLRSQRTLVDTLKQTASFARRIDEQLVQIKSDNGISTVDATPVTVIRILGPDNSCADATSARSTPVEFSTTVGIVTLRNETEQPLSIFWLSPAGDRLPWGEIDPGASFDLTDLDGWRFVLTDSNGRCMAVL